MKNPRPRAVDFAALLELAESRFQSWHLRELRPERDRRITSLKRQSLMFAGRVHETIAIYEEYLAREVRKRVEFYAEVAHDSGNREMLSEQRLAEYRERIMTSVTNACMALRDAIERDARADGNVSPTLLNALLKSPDQLHPGILDVVNSELGVLEAERRLLVKTEPEAEDSIIGKLPKDALVRMEAATAAFTLFVMRANPWAEIPEADRAAAWHVGAITGEALSHAALKLRAEAWKRAAEGGFPKANQAGARQPSRDDLAGNGAVPAVSGTNPTKPEGKGRKRGPKPDSEGAATVFEVVERLAPDGDWRPKLDDICGALDEAQVPYPARWRKRDRSCKGWADYDERANAVKAIEYRLQIAKQRKKATRETLS